MKILKTAILISLLSVSFNSFADLNTGLVAYWSFDDCTAKDNSGNGHNGTINGNPQCVDGKKGKGLYFDGIDDYIYVPLTQDLKFNPNTQSFSLSGWIKPIKTNMFNSAYTQYMPPNFIDTYTYLITSGGFTAKQNVYTGEAGVYISNPLFDKDNWHLFSGVSKVEGTKVTSSFYIDGILLATKDFDVIPNGSYPWNGLFIGKTYHLYGGLSEFFGDDIRIYNRALTDSEITSLYNQGNSSNTMASLCLVTNKSHASDLTKVIEVDVANTIIFPESVDVVSQYRNLLMQKDLSYKTTKKLYNQISYLKQKGSNSIATTIGSISAKDSSKAWSNYLESAKVFDDINKLSANRKIALAQYAKIKKQLKAKPSPIHKAGAIAGGALTLYSTACGMYEMYEDILNIKDGQDLIYDSAQLSLDTVNVLGGFLSLKELVFNVPAGTVSKALSKSAAFLLIPQVVSIGYEWARDNELYDQLDSILNTHSSTLEMRYFIVDKIVEELVNFDANTQSIDDLRGGIYSILNSYIAIHRADGSLFTLQQGFTDYLFNVSFLQNTFNKTNYQELTPPELASVAAIYVLGEAASLENIELRTTSINNLTKPPVWGDIIAGAFGGKDSYQVFKDVRSQILTSLDYDVYADLRYRFDSSFYQKYTAVLRQIGDKIHYYEQP